MSAPAACPWCWGEHAQCPYSAEEARAVRKARKARQAARKGRDSGTLPEARSELRPDAEIAGEMRDGEPPLAGAQRRLGKRGPKASASRSARYRRRHPEYVERERGRLARLRARGQQPGGAS